MVAIWAFYSYNFEFLSLLFCLSLTFDLFIGKNGSHWVFLAVLGLLNDEDRIKNYV